MDKEQWRLALNLCSWLRYALSQQGLSDPEVEEVHRRAKEALAEQVTRERTEHEREEERERRLLRTVMRQIISADWDGALDSIEVLYQDGANREEAIRLLLELKGRIATLLSPKYRQADQRAAALGKRFDELVERVGGSPLLGGNWLRNQSID